MPGSFDAVEVGCGDLIRATGAAAITCGLMHISDITEGHCKSYAFYLKQFHLHWGETDSAGSEHHVNGRPYAAEVLALSKSNRAGNHE